MSAPSYYGLPPNANFKKAQVENAKILTAFSTPAQKEQDLKRQYALSLQNDALRARVIGELNVGQTYSDTVRVENIFKKTMEELINIVKQLEINNPTDIRLKAIKSIAYGNDDITESQIEYLVEQERKQNPKYVVIDYRTIDRIANVLEARLTGVSLTQVQRNALKTAVSSIQSNMPVTNARYVAKFKEIYNILDNKTLLNTVEEKVEEPEAPSGEGLKVPKTERPAKMKATKMDDELLQEDAPVVDAKVDDAVKDIRQSSATNSREVGEIIKDIKEYADNVETDVTESGLFIRLQFYNAKNGIFNRIAKSSISGRTREQSEQLAEAIIHWMDRIENSKRYENLVLRRSLKKNTLRLEQINSFIKNYRRIADDIMARMYSEPSGPAKVEISASAESLPVVDPSGSYILKRIRPLVKVDESKAVDDVAKTPSTGASDGIVGAAVGDPDSTDITMGTISSIRSVPTGGDPAAVTDGGPDMSEEPIATAVRSAKPGISDGVSKDATEMPDASYTVSGIIPQTDPDMASAGEERKSDSIRSGLQSSDSKTVPYFLDYKGDESHDVLASLVNEIITNTKKDKKLKVTETALNRWESSFTSWADGNHADTPFRDYTGLMSFTLKSGNTLYTYKLDPENKRLFRASETPVTAKKGSGSVDDNKVAMELSSFLNSLRK